MTSSKKKHHPPAAATPRPTPKAAPRTTPKAASGPTPKAAARPSAGPKPSAATVNKFSATRRQLIVRGFAVLGVLVGLGMVLIGATPDIAGGWGKLLLMVPGALIIAASCIVFVETTSNARSLRIRR